MNFVELTYLDGIISSINISKVSELIGIKEGTRILFDFSVQDDYAYTDVKESVKEILTKAKENELKWNL